MLLLFFLAEALQPYSLAHKDAIMESRGNFPSLFLCRVSFLDGPRTERVAAWDGWTVLALGRESRGKRCYLSKNKEPKQNQAFFFFFLISRQAVELYDLAAGLFVSETWLRRFVQTFR